MSSYLVFAIAYYCRFPKLSLSRRVDWEFDPLTFWYQSLWKHKASHYFYEVFNDFVSFFKVMLLGEDAPRISDQDTKVLDKKGALEAMDDYNVIRIFGSIEKTTLLPCHITDIMFVTKIARQSTTSCIYSMRREKKSLFLCLG
jgi:hypothetical protein